MSAANSSAADFPQPKKGVMEIHAYVPGKSKAPDGVKLTKLSSNETPLGPSPLAKQAYEAVSGNLEDYPDGSSSNLREAIAKAHGLNPDHILCGNGSDDLLSLIANAYLGDGDEAIFTEHGFLVYKISILANSATPVVAPETDFTANVDAILERVTEKTKVVFLANPNNPTGTYIPFDEVKRLHEGLPSSVLLVMDAAYAEYVRRNDYAAGLELVASSNNVIMTRTFSKIHGLAALRIGWCYANPNIIDVLNRIRGPFNVNSAAIAAGTAAIGDQAHVDSAIEHNEKWVPIVTEKLQTIGLEVTPSVGNFILIHFDSAPNTKTAAGADEFLSSHGLILRAVAAYGLPNALRMTIGDEEANLAVISALTDFLGN